jgi:hypothetical protein
MNRDKLIQLEMLTADAMNAVIRGHTDEAKTHILAIHHELLMAQERLKQPVRVQHLLRCAVCGDDMGGTPCESRFCGREYDHVGDEAHAECDERYDESRAWDLGFDDDGEEFV